MVRIGVLPRNVMTITSDPHSWMQQARAVFTTTSMGNNRIYNDPAKSQYSGKITTIAIPISKRFGRSLKLRRRRSNFGYGNPKEREE